MSWMSLLGLFLNNFFFAFNKYYILKHIFHLLLLYRNEIKSSHFNQLLSVILFRVICQPIPVGVLYCN